MNLKISKVKNENGICEFYFEEMGHRDIFDILAKLILEKDSIKVDRKIEGIAIREWRFVGNNISFYLMHDDHLGNYLLSDNEEYNFAVERIADFVLKKVLLLLSQKRYKFEQQ